MKYSSIFRLIRIVTWSSKSKTQIHWVAPWPLSVPSGCPFCSNMVYSCSMPNHGCSSFTFSIAFTQVLRRLLARMGRKAVFAFTPYLCQCFLLIGSIKSYVLVNYTRSVIQMYYLLVHTYSYTCTYLYDRN